MIIEILALYGILALTANTAHYIANWRNISNSLKTLQGEEISKDNNIAVICPCRIANMEDREKIGFRETLKIITDNKHVKKTILVVEEDDNESEVVEKDIEDKLQVIKINQNTLKMLEKHLGRKPLYGKTKALIAGTLEILKHRGYRGILYIDCDNLVNPHSINIVAKNIESGELITGYRWYILDNIYGVLYNLISSIAFEGMGFYTSRIVWGGFMCIKRDLIDKYKIVEKWVEEFADDALVKKVFSDNRRKIIFCPQCISLTPPPKSTIKDFWRWSSRQLFIIKLYTPRGYRLLLLGYLAMTLTILLPLIMYSYSGFSIYTAIAIGIALGNIAIGILRGIKHYKLAKYSWIKLNKHREIGFIDKTPYILLYIIANSIKAPLVLSILISLYKTRKIIWRGREYCIKIYRENSIRKTEISEC